MKKQLLLFALMLLPMVASAYEGEAVIDGIKYYIVTMAKTAEVIQKIYSGDVSVDVIIPETIEYEGVTCDVTSIRQDAFSGCKGLTSIDIPNSVTSIGVGAFGQCVGLTSIIVESGNPIYDSRDNCNAIIRTADNVLIAGCQSTIIPNSVTSIGELAFAACTGLTSITIPNSVTSIGDWAFTGCVGLTSITIPNSVNNIGYGAFSCCGLTSVTIPNSVISIRSSAFGWCTSLTSITIPNSVTSIGSEAFIECTSLTSITIPTSVNNIGHGAFEDCSDLTSITIPNSVTSIGSSAFKGCGNIEDVYCFAEAVPSTKTSAFDNSNIQSATLHVPEGSVSEYANTDPWSQFGSIVEMGKCATPTITYANGKVRFACETEDVEFISTVTCSPTKLQNGSELEIGGTFTVSVYATKEGCIDSEVATKTINMSQVGDIDADGQITVSDITSLVNLLLGK